MTSEQTGVVSPGVHFIGSDLQFILADLAMKSNVDESIRLGRQVQKSVVGRLRQDYSGVQDHGLKHALFYVLMGARMPAILVETSFLSNKVEEDRLRNDWLLLLGERRVALTVDSVLAMSPTGEMSVTDATAAYGIGNWHLYNGRTDRAMTFEGSRLSSRQAPRQ